jgi:hypothetical protein
MPIMIFSPVTNFRNHPLGYFLVPKLQSSTSSISKIYNKKLTTFGKYAKKNLICIMKQASIIIRDQTIIRETGHLSTMYLHS